MFCSTNLPYSFLSNVGLLSVFSIRIYSSIEFFNSWASVTTDGNIIKNITLFAILIYELVGPYLTKQALIKAGDIVPKESITNKIRTYKK